MELRQRNVQSGRRRTIKSVKRSCDRLWSQLIRSGGACVRCGATPEDQRGFHPHHVYGRANHRLRWNPRNGIALCYPCHNWAHTNPLEFADWFRSIRPEDAEYLAEENRRGLLKRNLHDYLELETELQEALRAAVSDSEAA